MTTKALIALFVLGAIWGASFMFMRISTPEFGVMPLVFVRAFLAALVLVPFVFAAKAWSHVRQYWRPISVVGLVNTVIPFALFNYSSLYLQAGVNAILNATAPMFATLIAVMWLKDTISRLAVFGLVLGFTGVFVISAEKATASNISLLPIVAALCATFCYGIAASYIKRYLTQCKPIALAAGSQMAASLVLIIPAFLQMPTAMPSQLAWASALGLAIFGTGIAYILYFYLIAAAGPAKAITVGYLVPLFGIVWGVLLLDERLSGLVLLGGALILIGVMLTTGFLQLKRFSR